jgi:GntR family transcriptional repressor for pyruvate dehydrogenase complex
MKLLGVGRSSLREGIRILEVNGVVEIREGKGTFVAPGPPDHHTVRMQFLSDKRTALQALKVRRYLETLAVEEAIENATEEDLKAIGEALDSLERARAEGRSNTREDAAFHQLIYKVSGNDVLAQVLSAIKELSLFWENPLGDSHLFDDSHEFHRPIYDAICARNKAAGRKSVRRLMDRIEANIRKKRP